MVLKYKFWHDKCVFYCRLAQSESVHYFRFDKDGELFVYELGAGFSGPCYKVEQGFELDDVTQMSHFGSTLDKSEGFDSSSLTPLLSQTSVTNSNVTENMSVNRSVLFYFIRFRS